MIVSKARIQADDEINSGKASEFGHPCALGFELAPLSTSIQPLWYERVDMRFPRKTNLCDGELIAAQDLRKLLHCVSLQPYSLSKACRSRGESVRLHMWVEINVKLLGLIHL